MPLIKWVWQAFDPSAYTSGGVPANFIGRMVRGGRPAGQRSVTIAPFGPLPGTYEYDYFVSDPGSPGVASWAAGSWTLRVNILQAASNVTLRIRTNRINRDGTVNFGGVTQQSVEIDCSTTGLKAVVCEAFATIAANLSDRVLVEFEWKNTLLQQLQTVVFSLGHATNDTCSSTINESVVPAYVEDYPHQIITMGQWVNVGGDPAFPVRSVIQPVSLAEALDASYWRYTRPVDAPIGDPATAFEVRLTPPPDPDLGLFQIDCSSLGTATPIPREIRVELREGARLVAAAVLTGGQSLFGLSQTEKDTIFDWADLRLRAYVTALSELGSVRVYGLEALAYIDLAPPTFPVTNGLFPTYDIISPVITAGHAIVYAITTIAQVAANLDARWDLRQVVKQDGALPWDIRQLASSPVALPYDIGAVTAVFASLNLPYEIRPPALAAVGATLGVPYDITTQVAALIDLRWDLRQPASLPVDLRWDILAAAIQAGANLDARWDLRQVVSEQMNLAWGLRVNAGASVAVEYSMASGTAGASLTLAYVVSDALRSRYPLAERLKEIGLEP